LLGTGGSSITIGKFNMIDVASGTPIVGGGGIDTFQHIAFAAPPTLLLPPYIYGGVLTINTEWARFTGAIYDPRNAHSLPITEAFKDGIAGMLSVSVPVKIGELPGFQNITLRANNRSLPDLTDLPPLIAFGLPPAGTRPGAWYLGYSFQQYLQMTDEKHGWGIFGSIGITDRDPTPLGGGGTIGIAGNSSIEGREDDLFGLGYFYHFFSPGLVTALAPIVTLGPEHGIEAFYNFHLAPGVRLTADLQVIDPSIGDALTVYGGLRLGARF
jgi:porin